ncbi:MAG: phosphatase PAP2 family protein [Clostridia bacterium]|nr:phosphatase PAP2 family protein [Clostridia bacterium]MBQ4248717.1 phosphatase PAP2 family protein [Clostridia bacterium]
MTDNLKRAFFPGAAFIAAFVVWTILIKTVDVQPLGLNGTNIGFASFNCMFHRLTGVNMRLYVLTDWLGLVPMSVCIIFGALGVSQTVRRKSLLKADSDIIILGIYYAVVICIYLIFETIPVNYRPVLIDGNMEYSYPSSTTLLVLCVMPTLIEQAHRRLSDTALKKAICVPAVIFSAFMVTGRLVSGVHWFTDIAGAVFLSAGLFGMYRTCVLTFSKKEK